MTLREMLGGITLCAWLFHWMRVVASGDLEVDAIWLVTSAVVWAVLLTKCRGRSQRNIGVTAAVAIVVWVVFFAWIALFVLAVTPDAAPKVVDGPVGQFFMVVLGVMHAVYGIPAGVILCRQLRSLVTPTKDRCDYAKAIRTYFRR